MGTESNGKRRLTRRRVLKAGATALGGGTALLAGMPAVGAQKRRPRPCSPTRRRDARSAGSCATTATLDVQEMRLLPIDPRQVVIRSTGRRAVLHDRARRAQHQPDSPRRGPQPLRLRRRRGSWRDGQARAGRRSRRRRRHLAVRPVLPVPARPTGLLSVHLLLERAGRRGISAVRADARRHAGVRAGRHRRHERDHDRLRGVLRARSSPTCPPRN